MNHHCFGLREHTRDEGHTSERTLRLSMDEDGVSYAIIYPSATSETQLRQTGQEDVYSCPEYQAILHTRKGSIFLEALQPNVMIQTYAACFAGDDANGYEALPQSKNGDRFRIQIRPNDSLFIGRKTFSLNVSKVLQAKSTAAEVSTDISHQDRVNRSDESNLASEAPAAREHYQPHSVSSNTRHAEEHAPSAHPTEETGLNVIAEKESIPGKQLDDYAHSIVDVLDSNEPPPKRQKLDEAAITRSSRQDEETQESMMSVIRFEPTAVSSKPSRRSNSQQVAEVSNGSQERHRQAAPALDNEGEELHISPNLQEPGEQRRGDSSLSGEDQPEVVEATITERKVNQEPSASDPAEAHESSARSTRSSPRQKQATSGSVPVGLKILFANSTSIDAWKNTMRFLESHGVERVSTVDECTHLCVKNAADVKKTSKLIMAVLHGKEIIGYDWVVKSVKGKKLLDPSEYLVRDPEREREWGVKLDEAIAKAKSAKIEPFSGWDVVFTPAAKGDAGRLGFGELKEIVLHAGAKSCSTRLPKGDPSEHQETTLIIAIQKDPSISMLKGDWRCYSRDIIGLSALRGRLDTSHDEFLISDRTTAVMSMKRRSR